MANPTLARAVHPSNALLLMELTIELANSTEARAVQCWNAREPISRTFELANPTLARAVHPSNALRPMELTFELANATRVREVQFRNAHFPIKLTLECPKSMDTGCFLHPTKL